jgi:hypothetical protein
VHDFARLPEREYSFLLGFYLGDGTISTSQKGVHALRIFNDSRYVAVLAECAVAVAAVMPNNRVGFVLRARCIELISRSKAWPCLFPQHGPGRKHERPIELAEWQSKIVRRHPHQFLRGLFHSDGCRVTNVAVNRTGQRYEYPRYFFTNASEDIRELCCAALQQVGVRYTQPSERVISVARACSVAYLDRFIGPKA